MHRATNARACQASKSGQCYDRHRLDRPDAVEVLTHSLGIKPIDHDFVLCFHARSFIPCVAARQITYYAANSRHTIHRSLRRKCARRRPLACAGRLRRFGDESRSAPRNGKARHPLWVINGPQDPEILLSVRPPGADMPVNGSFAPEAVDRQTGSAISRGSAAERGVTISRSGRFKLFVS